MLRSPPRIGCQRSRFGTGSAGTVLGRLPLPITGVSSVAPDELLRLVRLARRRARTALPPGAEKRPPPCDGTAVALPTCRSFHLRACARRQAQRPPCARLACAPG